MPSPGTQRASRAFTLIELLVVISIIALLIGILLPALGSARGAARSIVCLTNMRSASLALHTYAADNRNFMPGMNTSGAVMAGMGGLSNAELAERAASSATQPLQADDWVSPLLGSELGLSSDPAERILDIFNSAYSCPANDVRYVDRFSGGDLYGLPFEQSLISSYSMGITWQLRKDGIANRDQVDGDGLITLTQLGTSSNFNFTLDSIKDQGGKAIFSEGVRFLQNAGGNNEGFTYSGFARSTQGSNWSHAGWIFTGGGNPYKFGTGAGQSTDTVSVDSPIPISVAGAFRHPANTINQGQADGSASTLSPLEASAIDRHVPKGTLINSSQTTPDPNDEDGQRVF